MQVCLLIAIVLAVTSTSTGANTAEPPATAFWNGAHLAEVRAGRDEKQPEYREVLKRLRKNAEIAFQRGPYSVMDKKEAAPSGDKHDYLSYARYWWPNPDSRDGLPFVRRDGRTNEKLLQQGDRETIGAMYDDVETLALAGYLLDDDRYRDHSAMLIRNWFLDSNSRMNPSLTFGQAIPGRVEGRGSGIIDTRHFIRVLDSVRLLETSDSWSEDDSGKLRTWMEQYLHWLLTSPGGKEERGGGNNHGTWCDSQTVAIALYVGDRALAKQIVERAKQGRIARCIEPDGSQPAEMTRTKSLHYCVFNLSAMSVLARLGESVNVDLWSYETSDGRSIRRALDFVTPYVAGKQKWKHEQIEKLNISPTDMGLFYLAASRYHEPAYVAALKEDARRPAKFEYTRLLFPAN